MIAAWLRRLGGLWIKLGQILSLRLDISPALRGQLATLQSAGGVGSVATVTRERVGGRWRAVKRIAPRTRVRYARQLRRLGWLVALAHPILPRLKLRPALAALRATLHEELDLRYEASQARELRAVLKGTPVSVPRVSRTRSAADVLVSDWADGTLLSDALATGVGAFDRSVVAERLLASALAQIRANCFHRDLHPGNILVGRRHRIVLVDANVGHVDAWFLATFLSQLRALIDTEYRRAAILTLLLCDGIAFHWWWREQRRARHVDQLIGTITGIFRRWTQRARVCGLPYAERSIMGAMEEVSAAVLRARGQFRWEWFDLQRTLLTLDGTLAQLDPELDPLPIFRAALPPCAVSAEIEQLPETLRLAGLRLHLGAFMR